MKISLDKEPGIPKSRALHDWQVKFGISDDDPMYPVAMLVFDLHLHTPDLVYELTGEFAKGNRAIAAAALLIENYTREMRELVRELRMFRQGNGDGTP